MSSLAGAVGVAGGSRTSEAAYFSRRVLHWQQEWVRVGAAQTDRRSLLWRAETSLCEREAMRS